MALYLFGAGGSPLLNALGSKEELPAFEEVMAALEAWGLAEGERLRVKGGASHLRGGDGRSGGLGLCRGGYIVDPGRPSVLRHKGFFPFRRALPEAKAERGLRIPLQGLEWGAHSSCSGSCGRGPGWLGRLGLLLSVASRSAFSS